MHARKGFFITLCSVISIVLWLALRVEAIDFQVAQWTTEQGLPQNTILAITQTPDRYLWLATFNGLVRFDGVQFTVFNPVNTPALRSGRILDLQVDRHGWLWIFSEEGDLTRLAEGRFEVANGRWGLPNLPCSSKGNDPGGNPWVAIAYSGQLLRLSGKTFVPGDSAESLSAADLERVSAGAPTVMWLPKEKGWVYLPTQIFRNWFHARGVSVTGVVGPARDGGVWALNGQELRRIHPDILRAFSPSPGLERATTLSEGSHGDLWIGTWTEGLFVIHPTGEPVRIQLGLNGAGERLRTLFVDHEENLWVGSDVTGLYRVKPRLFQTFNRQNGLNGEIVKSVLDDAKGNVWVVHENGIDWIRPGDAVVKREAEPLLQLIGRETRLLWSASHDAQGDAWFGSWGGDIWRWHGDSVEAFPSQPDFDRGRIRVFAPRRDGGMWLGTSKGLWRVDGLSVTAEPLPDDLTSHDVRAVCDEPNGPLCVGIYGGGLVRREGNRWVRYGKREGLTDDEVICLYQDADQAIWIGTVFGGLSRFKGGKFFNFESVSLRLPKLVSCILEDDPGHLWLGSVDGLHRVDRKELNEMAAGSSRKVFVYSYGKKDGLGTTECAYGMQPTALKARDGRLWFATINGVSVVDPKNLPFNSKPPPVRIEEVLVDGRAIEILSPDQGLITLSPKNYRLEIRYTALSFTAPEKMRFKFRLEDLTTEWTDAGARRSAFFEGLRPGSYRFRVAGSNNDGVWNETGASLAFMVLPFYWQTAWFRGLVGMVFGGLVLFSYRQRIGRLEEERVVQRDFSRRLIESQETERKRIASELHDSLGQNILVVKNSALLGLSDEVTHEEMAEHFEQISQIASQSLEEVRTIAHNLRPYQLDQIGLSKSLDTLLSVVARSSGIKFTVEKGPLDNLFLREEEIHIYRIVQESLNNLLKHSRATAAHVTIGKKARLFRFTLKDDGQGFQTSPGPGEASFRSGFGVSGMAERVKILGGAFAIESAPGRGTLLSVVIPLKHTPDAS